MAMEEKKFNVGDLVIEQGTDGDDLYVVEEGTLECTKVFVSGYNCQSGSTEPKFLKNYEPGEAFGELALLYNAPRAATIKAKTPSIIHSNVIPQLAASTKKVTTAKSEQVQEAMSRLGELEKVLNSYEELEMDKSQNLKSLVETILQKAAKI